MATSGWPVVRCDFRVSCPERPAATPSDRRFPVSCSITRHVVRLSTRPGARRPPGGPARRGRWPCSCSLATGVVAVLDLHTLVLVPVALVGAGRASSRSARSGPRRDRRALRRRRLPGPAGPRCRGEGGRLDGRRGRGHGAPPRRPLRGAPPARRAHDHHPGATRVAADREAFVRDLRAHLQRGQRRSGRSTGPDSAAGRACLVACAGCQRSRVIASPPTCRRRRRLVRSMAPAC